MPRPNRNYALLSLTISRSAENFELLFHLLLLTNSLTLASLKPSARPHDFTPLEPAKNQLRTRFASAHLKMHATLFSSSVAILLGVVSANPDCSSNAGINWTVQSTGNENYNVKIDVNGGQNKERITSDTVLRAFVDCANRKATCSGDLGTKFTCNYSPEQHPAQGAKGSGNIEFECKETPYTCYEFAWNN